MRDYYKSKFKKLLYPYNALKTYVKEMKGTQMAMTPEKKVKDAVVKVLKQYGVYHFFPVTGGFGRSGVPDIVGCYKGNFLAIECKAGKNKTTALQDAEIAKIYKAGGLALVVSEKNIEDVAKLLDTITYMRELSERN